jgi:hypothetical protein
VTRPKSACRPAGTEGEWTEDDGEGEVDSEGIAEWDHEEQEGSVTDLEEEEEEAVEGDDVIRSELEETDAHDHCTEGETWVQATKEREDSLQYTIWIKTEDDRGQVRAFQVHRQTRLQNVIEAHQKITRQPQKKSIKLFHGSTQLQPEQTIEDAGIQNGDTIRTTSASVDLEPYSAGPPCPSERRCASGSAGEAVAHVVADNA